MSDRRATHLALLALGARHAERGRASADVPAVEDLTRHERPDNRGADPAACLPDDDRALDRRRSRARAAARAEMTWDGTDFFDALLGALRRRAQAKGYRLVHTDLAGVDAFLVREDLPGPLLTQQRVPAPPLSHLLSGVGPPLHQGDRRFVDAGS